MERDEKDVIFTVTRAWDKFSAQNVHIFNMHDKITIKIVRYFVVYFVVLCIHFRT